MDQLLLVNRLASSRAIESNYANTRKVLTHPLANLVETSELLVSLDRGELPTTALRLECE